MAVKALTYREFLSEFISSFVSAGPRFPEAYTHFNLGVSDFIHGVSEFQVAVAILVGRPVPAMFAASDFSPTPQEVELENGLILKLRGNEVAAAEGEKFGAIGDGTFIQFLRNLYTFIQAHPEVWTLILSLLRSSKAA